MMMSHGSNHLTKKRKANDGKAAMDGAQDVSNGNTNDGGGFLSSWFGYFSGRSDCVLSGSSGYENSIHQSLSQINTTMTRMEEKLATVSRLERKCEHLEAKCSSLETMLESMLQSTKEQTDGCSSLDKKMETTLKSMKEHIDKKFKFHEVLMHNQKWEYSARVRTKNELERWGYEANVADYIYETSQNLKKSTEAMRRGKFPEYGQMVSFHTSDDEYLFDDVDIMNELSPHWREFAAALTQFKPAFGVLPDDVCTCIKFGTVILNEETTQLIKESLAYMPFKILYLENDPRIHGGMGTISSIMRKNNQLLKLEIYQFYDMDRSEIGELCSAIHRHPSLSHVSMIDCFSDGLGDEVLRTLFSTNELKLERLDMSDNELTLDGIAPLSNFLATNPRLKNLDLSDNDLDDGSAVSLANALRSNTTLRNLFITEDCVGQVGEEAFRSVFRDETSLNSIADTNHSCMLETVKGCDDGNDSEVRETNRAMKIYALLDSRHQKMSNVQHFDCIGLKLLPNVLEAVQKYSNTTNEYLKSRKYEWHYVNPMSIVYEVMHGWDKVSPLYKKYSK